MKVGLYIPQVGSAANSQRIINVAQTAESAGFDSLWVFDHVVLREDYGTPYPYSANGSLGIPATMDFLEALTLLTYVAAITSRIELGTAVLILPMRAPVLHAKMMATLDHLAGGRLILGAGVGWWKEEIETLGMPFENRGKRMDEYLQVLRQLWSQDFGTFKGEYYDIDGWACAPKPPRQIPILLGGNSKAQLRRIGQFADGWLANPAMLENLQADFERAKSWAVRYNRDPEKLELAVNRVAVLSSDTKQQAADELVRLKDLGVHHAILNLHPAEADPQALIEEFSTEYLADIQR